MGKKGERREKETENTSNTETNLTDYYRLEKNIKGKFRQVNSNK